VGVYVVADKEVLRGFGVGRTFPRLRVFACVAFVLTGERLAEYLAVVFVYLARRKVEFARDVNRKLPRVAVLAVGGRTLRPFEVDVLAVVSVEVVANSWTK